MKPISLFFFSLAFAVPAFAQTEFQVGLYADDARSITCVTGSAGDQFEQILWAYVPEDLALTYLTVRFRFPENLDLSARPNFNDQIGTVLYTDYVMNTVEWNMIFSGCPTGWVKVFSQPCVLQNSQPARIEILGQNSLTRDCAFFELNDLVVLNELEVNNPECTAVSARPHRWGTVKAAYR
ncbi:MAG: hypothetical protein ACI9UK_000384 [Candidatus Krumholzibacteriia bacterium]